MHIILNNKLEQILQETLEVVIKDHSFNIKLVMLMSFKKEVFQLIHIIKRSYRILEFNSIAN